MTAVTGQSVAISTSEEEAKAVSDSGYRQIPVEAVSLFRSAGRQLILAQGKVGPAQQIHVVDETSDRTPVGTIAKLAGHYFGATTQRGSSGLRRGEKTEQGCYK